MNRAFFWTFLLATCAVTALAAQEQQPPGDKGDKKEAADKSNDIMARLAKNLASAEERLKKTDPGDETRKIQRDIIADLEALIKQTSQQPSGGAGGKSQKSNNADKSSSTDKSSSKGGQSEKSDTGKDNQGNPNGKKSQDNQDPKQGAKGGANDPKGQVKPGKGDQGEAKDKGKGEGENKDGPAEQGKGKTGGKDLEKKKGKEGGDKGEVKANDNKENKDKGGQQASGGKAKQDPPLTGKQNLIPDLHRDVWGHLPEKLRLEMDTYSKERFMPRYEDLLQQYYRTIAEQASGKEK